MHLRPSPLSARASTFIPVRPRWLTEALYLRTNLGATAWARWGLRSIVYPVSEAAPPTIYYMFAARCDSYILVELTLRSLSIMEIPRSAHRQAYSNEIRFVQWNQTGEFGFVAEKGPRSLSGNRTIDKWRREFIQETKNRLSTSFEAERCMCVAPACLWHLTFDVMTLLAMKFWMMLWLVHGSTSTCLLNQGNLFEMMWSFSLPGMASLMSKYGHVRDWPWWIQSRQNSSWRTTTPKNKCLLNIYYIECACAPRELLCDLHCCCLLLPLPSRNPSPHPRRIALLFQNFKQISPSVII